MTEITTEETEREQKAKRYIRPTRAELVVALIERDGDLCRYCERDFSKRERTIDHVYPQSRAVEDGWTYEKIWDMSNLALSCKPCNAKKGDRILNEDGTIPTRRERTFRYRRDKRAQRAEVCESCLAGRLLGQNEWCNACGHGPQPGRFPKWRQMPVKDCDHDLFYCVSCTIWFPETRRSALGSLLTGGEGYE